jgi:2-C-methyl-D-erythritol 4-phosphate cytidylyltransferase
MQKKYIIIVAGGTGSRMNSELPKQFLLLKGKPIIIHTIEQFYRYDANITCIVVVHADYKLYLAETLQQFNLHHCNITEGGETRFHSVKNGLKLIENNEQGIVGIHDAARPLVSIETIGRCYELAAEKGCVVPVITINESLRVVEGSKNKAVNRAHYRVVQTPQCFKTELMQKAYDQDYNELFTDDASVLEQGGHTIYLTEGNAENIKITQPQDLRLAELYLG